jgi:DNA-binding MarR family transcriptional regulator
LKVTTAKKPDQTAPNYGLMIRYTLRAFTRVLQDVAASYQITAAEFRILRTLGEGTALTQVELANLAAMDRPYAASIVKQLHTKGLVKRARNQEDRRRIDLLLTKRGTTLLAQISTKLETANRRAVSGIKSADLDAFNNVIDRMKRNLESYGGSS